MIRTSLVAEEIDSRIHVMCVPIFSRSKWLNVQDFLPRNCIRCTTNKESAELERIAVWRSLGWETGMLDVSGMEVISSSQMRKALLRGEDWRPFLHESVHSFFNDIDGPARMTNAARSLIQGVEDFTNG